MRIRKEYKQHPRTKEQAINVLYILKQQMECQVSMLAHDGNCGIYKKDDDDDNNDDGYNNNTQEADADADDAIGYEDEREREREGEM